MLTSNRIQLHKQLSQKQTCYDEIRKRDGRLCSYKDIHPLHLFYRERRLDSSKNKGFRRGKLHCISN